VQRTHQSKKAASSRRRPAQHAAQRSSTNKTKQTMPPRRVLSPQSVWDRDALLAAFAEAGVAPEHAHRVHFALLRDPSVTWHAIPSLPKAAAALLAARFARLTSRVLQVQRSGSGDTIKLLLELQDGLQVEAVIMSYDTTQRYAPGADAGDDAGDAGDAAAAGDDDADVADDEQGAAAAGGGKNERRRPRARGAQGHKRGTLCVSSQVGCQQGCSFCATGTMGLTGSLTAGEIVEQLVHARMAGAAVRNVVFMGASIGVSCGFVCVWLVLQGGRRVRVSNQKRCETSPNLQNNPKKQQAWASRWPTMRPSCRPCAR
jgi:hypothetical protein